MSQYRLEIRPSVEKTLGKLRDKELQQRIAQAFEKLSQNPRLPRAEKMSDFNNRYRFRVGDYRIFYELLDAVPRCR
jgi:mRNA interferase RelE/StbE